MNNKGEVLKAVGLVYGTVKSWCGQNRAGQVHSDGAMIGEEAQREIGRAWLEQRQKETRQEAEHGGSGLLRSKACWETEHGAMGVKEHRHGTWLCD